MSKFIITSIFSFFVMYMCACVSDLNYPKQIVILAACPF